MDLNSITITTLPRIEDRRGNLSFIEGNRHVPFEIARTYCIYDVPGGQFRSGHAYRTQEEFIVALSGSFDIVFTDGKQERTITLNRSYNGVYVPPMMWRQLTNFSTNSVALVVSSMSFNESDYIRDFDEYKRLQYEKDDRI